MKVLFNGLTGKFEVKQTFDASLIDTVIRRTWNCNAPAAIGDFVYLDPSVTNKVLVNTDNNIIYPTIGVIVSKISATICRVILYGEMTGFSGLTQGQHVHLSTLGTATSSTPATGYLQILGYALEPTKIMINPQILRTKRA